MQTTGSSHLTEPSPSWAGLWGCKKSPAHPGAYWKGPTWEDVTCFSPIALTTAASSPRSPPVAKLGLGWLIPPGGSQAQAQGGARMSKDWVLGERQAPRRHCAVRTGHERELISGEAVSNQRLLPFILLPREPCSLQKGVPTVCLEGRARSKGAAKPWVQLPSCSGFLLAITGLAFQHLQLSKKNLSIPLHI